MALQGPHASCPGQVAQLLPALRACGQPCQGHTAEMGNTSAHLVPAPLPSGSTPGQGFRTRRGQAGGGQGAWLSPASCQPRSGTRSLQAGTPWQRGCGASPSPWHWGHVSGARLSCSWLLGAHSSEGLLPAGRDQGKAGLSQNTPQSHRGVPSSPALPMSPGGSVCLLVIHSPALI